MAIYGLDLSDVSFDYLEEINLRSSNISATAVAQIFSKAKNLKIINLFACKTLDNLDLSGILLHSLQEFNLSDSYASGAVVAQFFSQAKNLKKISLVRCENLCGLSLLDISFDYLEEINLWNSNIFAATVAQIVSKAKSLKKINSDIELSSLNLSGISFSCLAKNNLENSNISVVAAGAQIFGQDENLKKNMLLPDSEMQAVTQNAASKNIDVSQDAERNFLPLFTELSAMTAVETKETTKFRAFR